MQNTNEVNGYEAVIRLLRDNPDWFPVVQSALEEAKSIPSGIFAGKWVLDKAKRHGVTWIPSLRKLVAYGVLTKVGESTRGGRRAYYSMPNAQGVEKALKEISPDKPIAPYRGYEVTKSGIAQRATIHVPFFGNLASCGSPNDSETFIEEYMDVKTTLAKPGYKYFIVRADGDSMDLGGIKSGDLVLVRVQNYADVGQKVVASLENGMTIKELQYQGDHLVLMPHSSNPENKIVPLTTNTEIQGVVVTVLNLDEE
jgi:SOS-response transcriptional repressor LexA